MGNVAIFRWDCWTCHKRIMRGDYDRNAFSGPKTQSSMFETKNSDAMKCPNCGSVDISGGKVWYCGNNYTREGCHGHHGPDSMRCLDT